MARGNAPEQKKKKGPAPVPKQAYEVTVEIDGEVKFDKAVEVRRPSELNGIASTYKAAVGQTIVWTAKRVF